MLDSSTTIALRAELEETRKAVRAGEERIKALELLIGDAAPAPEKALLKLPGVFARLGERFINSTAADALRTVIGEKPGLTQEDVIAAVLGNGLKFDGGTPRRLRVQNELYRLVKRGVLVKQSGRYFLAAVARPDGEDEP